MELQIGNKIAELRKLKGMTQEQLAFELGISASAISKWETDASYPDITILCPLARALETNVDTLLEYEENLSEEEVYAYAENIVKIRQEQGIDKAERELKKLLFQYPNCIALKFCAVAIFTSFEIQNMSMTDDDKQKWNRQKRKLLEEIYESKNVDYHQSAISSLAALELQSDHFDEAERLLKELPEPSADVTGLWVRLYLQKGDAQKATEILQKRLYTLLYQANACLLTMLENMQADGNTVLELCAIYEKLDEIIYAGKGESDLVLAEVYGKRGEEQLAVSYLKSYLENHIEKWPKPNPLLFASAIHAAEEGRVPSKEIKEMLLRGIMADDILSKLCETEKIKSILQNWESAGENNRSL